MSPLPHFNTKLTYVSYYFNTSYIKKNDIDINYNIREHKLVVDGNLYFYYSVNRVNSKIYLTHIFLEKKKKLKKHILDQKEYYIGVDHIGGLFFNIEDDYEKGKKQILKGIENSGFDKHTLDKIKLRNRNESLNDILNE
jgi:hypothetical protein